MPIQMFEIQLLSKQSHGMDMRMTDGSEVTLAVQRTV